MLRFRQVAKGHRDWRVICQGSFLPIFGFHCRSARVNIEAKIRRTMAKRLDVSPDLPLSPEALAELRQRNRPDVVNASCEQDPIW
jgi:hypothetical protein